MTPSISIPARSEIYALIKKHEPIGFDDIARQFMLNKPQGIAIERRLNAMVVDGQLSYLKNKAQYRTKDKLREVSGEAVGEDTVRVNGDETEWTLPRRLTHGVMRGDRVRLTTNAAGDILSLDIVRREAKIIGTFYAPAQLIPKTKSGLEYVNIAHGKIKPKNGDMVVAELLTPDDRRAVPQGRVVRILREQNAGDIETEAALAQFGVPCEWSRKVAQNSRKLDHNSAKSCANREDMRSLDFVTIDGESAHDFDDAIFCEEAKDGWLLHVAIADVAAYVRPNSELDDEASRRGNSVYMPRRVVPMLPESLSNDACSLKPNVDRLALVCAMHLSASGDIKSFEFCAATIRSSARLTYTQVARFFSAGALSGVSASVKKSLNCARQAYQILLQKRFARGALEIESSESLVAFDKHCEVKAIVGIERNDAHRMIEEFMICANVCAAKYLGERKEPFLSRVHSGYKDGAFDEFRRFLNKRGAHLRKDTCKALSAALEELSDAALRQTVERVLLGSITRAEYRPTNEGHFGLALEHYAHFTSPIRRYPDLLTHRAIHKTLKSKAGAQYRIGRLKALGEHCVMTEKRADNASRDLQRYYECQFMQNHIGERLSGHIVGVQSFGLFVRLNKFPIEGMVHITALPHDYYEYDRADWCLTGRASGRSYELGARMDIEVARVDPVERHIDFVLPNVAPRKPSRRRRRR